MKDFDWKEVVFDVHQQLQKHGEILPMEIDYAVRPDSSYLYSLDKTDDKITYIHRETPFENDWCKAMSENMLQSIKQCPFVHPVQQLKLQLSEHLPVYDRRHISERERATARFNEFKKHLY